MDKRIITLPNLLLATFFCTFQVSVSSTSTRQGKVCLGTKSGISTAGGSADARYRDLKQRYENCTYVDGNLELTWLTDNKNYNLSFLSSIEEVTGYVLVVVVHSTHLPLTSLRVIRGKDLYALGDNDYSLYISRNYDINDMNNGLQELQFKSLHEIMKGNVYISDNPRLCYADKINWNDILSPSYTYSINGFNAQCPSCDPQCQASCWGEGPEMCQKLTKVICSPQCEDNRCFGPGPMDCCHSQCAGGCTGPTKSECWACKNFDNDGVCEPFCPKPFIYNKETYEREPNPNAKYQYGGLCVDECPSHMLADIESCVADCGPGRIAKDRKCYSCDGPCPKKCNGTKDHWVDATNIKTFENCTTVQGDIRILQSTFQGNNAIHPEELSVFKDVREITQYLSIQGTHEEFKNLDFFRNLELIHGRQTHSSGSALVILNTKIETLGLNSLETIGNGRVIVYGNTNLCYASTLNWKTLLSNPSEQKEVIQGNRNQSLCVQDGYVCDEQCLHGCWDKGASNCRQCRNYIFEDQCVETCDTNAGVFDSGSKTCTKCHEECLLKCTGPGSNSCESCKNVKDGPYCVAECPESKYPDDNKDCQDCHEFCVRGCKGPENTVGENACNTCEIALGRPEGNNVTIEECLAPDSGCPPLTYMTYWAWQMWGTAMKGKRVCLPCHPQCERCFGPGDSTLSCQCKHYAQEGKCRSQCTPGFYPIEEKGVCEKCHEFCTECYGPTQYDCHSCAKFKLYYNETQGLYNCTDECPYFAPYKTIDENEDKLCVSIDPKIDQVYQRRVFLGKIIGPIIAIVVIVIAAIIVTVFCMKRAKSLEREASFKAKLEGLEEEQPLTPTGAVPDLSHLRLIKESELKMGGIIGSGAFGTVYKGVWIPEGENVKIPIAIKVLQESTSASQNTELLEEARVMASVTHPCCIRILGVCMTAQMMLITQLMPLGCLLDYVRNNKKNIGSKSLLNWCTQIAKGMAYLEEHGIVHRDLAARNVLVQSATKVRITDFGLAKMLDYNAEEFHESGGKMPIKWLALESIQHRLYTHKSDVWSFGVTVWELFTFGQKPYENTRAWDIPDLLSKGERLPQPTICTIDAYMILVKCWMLDAGSRPGFKELVDQFSRMARDPGRYLVIHGDQLLRLPSESIDTHELLRGMSVLSGDIEPDEVMAADEYLRPVGGSSPPLSPLDMVPELDEQVKYENHPSPTHQNNNFKPYMERQGAFDEVDGASCMPPSPRKPGRNTSSLASQDSFKGRYTSDPCSPKQFPPSPKKQNFEPPIEMSNLPQNLPPPPPTPLDKVGPPPPVPQFNPANYNDEDNYLQPKSKQDSYLNVEGDAPPQDYMAMDKPAVDNPEYFNAPVYNGRDSSRPLLDRTDSEYKNV